MPRRATVDVIALAALLAPGRSVATRAELRAVGVPSSTITHRCRPGGPWQRLLPGVVAGHRGTPTTHGRRLAAVKYAGGGAALTGLDALDELGISLTGLPTERRVHVVVPHGCHRQSHGFAIATRSERPPIVGSDWVLPRVGVARAVVDAARRVDHLDHARTLVVRVLQQRRSTVAELDAEVRRAPLQRTALVRAALLEVRAGTRSEAEAKVRLVLLRAGLPEPAWNVAVRDAAGEVIAVVDGLWEEERVVLEVDSIEWHLEPAHLRRTQRRHRRLVLAGMTVVSVAPSDVLDDPEQFCRYLRDLLAAARTRVAADRLAVTNTTGHEAS